MNQLNIEQLRQDTPGCLQVLHFNNAGSALPTKTVVEAVKNHLDLELNVGGYEAATLVADKLKQFYRVAAQLIHCDHEEIAFVDNATRAWDMAFYSFKFHPGDKILTSRAEYASNYLAFLHQAKQSGVIIDVIENDDSGQLDVSDLTKKINKQVKLIAITHVPTQGGLVNPAEEVGQLANAARIPFLLDATQSIGQMPIDVKKIGCDFLCATGRKYLRGPRGTGFLYANRNIIEQCNPPFVDLHAAKWISDKAYILEPNALRFETWEQNVAAKIGLTEAIQYALTLNLDATFARIQQLAKRLRETLLNLKGVKIHDLGQKQCGIVSFSSTQKSPAEIQDFLRKKRMNVSLSLQEYSRLDMVKRNLPAVVRASVHYYNTETEVDVFCTELSKFLNN
nr:aminotransferase class V-fold PLP-dependent enzyme [Legionella jordanis]